MHIDVCAYEEQRIPDAFHLPGAPGALPPTSGVTPAGGMVAGPRRFSGSWVCFECPNFESPVAAGASKLFFRAHRFLRKAEIINIYIYRYRYLHVCVCV